MNGRVWVFMCRGGEVSKARYHIFTWLLTGTGKTYIILKYAEVGRLGGVRGGVLMSGRVCV